VAKKGPPCRRGSNGRPCAAHKVSDAGLTPPQAGSLLLAKEQPFGALCHELQQKVSCHRLETGKVAARCFMDDCMALVSVDHGHKR
jgi:hypothetical protein